MRFVFVHNHIFKNAGSTIDHIFEKAGFRNTAMEATPECDTVYPRAIVDAVQRDPSIEYISSHVLRRPRPPDAENLGFIDITFVRHPVDRLYSIYRYFRHESVQDFPEIDKDSSFAKFVDRMVAVSPVHLHSSQTICLGNERNFHFPPGRAHLDAAKAAVADARFLGVVDLFDMSFEVFLHFCGTLVDGKDRSAMTGPFPVVNRSGEGDASLVAKLIRIKEELGDERYAYLERTNALDLELYRFAREELLRRHSLVAGAAG